MDNKYIDSRNPPYPWLSAYGLFDKEYKKVRKVLLDKARPLHPFLSEDCFKVIQIVSIPWNMVYNTMIVRGVYWRDVKESIIEQIKMIDDERKKLINIEEVEDIALSFTNLYDFQKYGCIDTVYYMPFDVIADNSIVFIHQIKMKGVWLFHK
jgi:hypothetical protein